MLNVKDLKEITKNMPDEAEVLIESIIDNDDALWTATNKAWADVDTEGGNKPCLVLQPSDIQIFDGDNNLSVADGEIQKNNIKKITFGKQLSFEEVQNLADGTEVWIENVSHEGKSFLGIKKENVITDAKGKMVWTLAADFQELCRAYEWKDKSKMNRLSRLLYKIQILQEVGLLEEDFNIFNQENPDIISIDELNETIETEMSYWE